MVIKNEISHEAERPFPKCDHRRNESSVELLGGVQYCAITSEGHNVIDHVLTSLRQLYIAQYFFRDTELRKQFSVLGERFVQGVMTNQLYFDIQFSFKALNEADEDIETAENMFVERFDEQDESSVDRGVEHDRFVLFQNREKATWFRLI